MTSALEALGSDFAGDLVDPDHPDYPTAARAVLASGSPAYVLRPTTVDDVRAAVRFAARAGRPLAVRGGGHSFAGFGTNDGGLVVELSRLADIEVLDADRRVVRIGGGATWGQVASVLEPHGLAISSGDTQSVGVGGLTLNGGIGWKVRKHGLAMDQLVAAEVVTASGNLVRADERENPELFWALRGGGGNFGIVTAFEFRAHESTDVHFGRLTFPAAEARHVLAGWAEHLRTAPDELTSNVVFANPFTGGPESPIEVRVAYDGDDPELAAAAIDPIRRLGTLLEDDVALTAYADVLEEGVVPPPGLGFLVRSGLVPTESVPAVLDTLADVGAAERSPVITLRSLGGAVARVPGDATAYAHRQAQLMIATSFIGPAPALTAARPAAAAIWDRLAPGVMGAYGNFLSSTTQEDVAAIYPAATRRRLAAVKREHDPDNLFAGNHNIGSH